MFNKLEESAGVPHIKNRGWMAFRRIGAELSRDVAREQPKKPEVIDTESPEGQMALNSITGHRLTKSRMRYLKKDDPHTMQRAAEIRGKTRRPRADGKQSADPDKSAQ